MTSLENLKDPAVRGPRHYEAQLAKGRLRVDGWMDSSVCLGAPPSTLYSAVPSCCVHVCCLPGSCKRLGLPPDPFEEGTGRNWFLDQKRRALHPSLNLCHWGGTSLETTEVLVPQYSHLSSGGWESSRPYLFQKIVVRIKGDILFEEVLM